MGSYVVVINAEKVVVTGNKEQQKMYYRHTGRPGSLKQENFKKLQAVRDCSRPLLAPKSEPSTGILSVILLLHVRHGGLFGTVPLLKVHHRRLITLPHIPIHESPPQGIPTEVPILAVSLIVTSLADRTRAGMPL